MEFQGGNAKTFGKKPGFPGGFNEIKWKIPGGNIEIDSKSRGLTSKE